MRCLFAYRRYRLAFRQPLRTAHGLWAERDIGGTKTDVITLDSGALMEYLWVKDAAIKLRGFERIGNG